MTMKTIKYKHSEASCGALTLAHPGARPGWQESGAFVIAADVPEGTTTLQAEHLINRTIIPTGVHTLPYEALGLNLYHADNRHLLAKCGRDADCVLMPA